MEDNPQTEEKGRTSLLIRCSREDAQKIHAEADAAHRSLSGYLLHVLERSLWIENRFVVGVAYIKQTPAVGTRENRTAIHLRCTADEATRIRAASKKRLLSISGFVLFSLQRHWKAVEIVRSG